MLNKIKETVLRYAYKDSNVWVQKLTEIYRHGYGASISFSQSGEDMVLKKLLSDKAGGFFVDVGAHHPIRYSNTFYFYLRGWNGINIDPMPGIMKQFEKVRPRDINLEIAVGKSGTEYYYIFEEGCYNTFDKDIAENLIEKKISRCTQRIAIPKIPLAEILRKHAGERKIELMSIDAEGLDVEILETNDWRQFRPSYICVEFNRADVSRPMNPGELLQNQNYELVAQTEFSSIYKCRAK
jgi:hypothetical protein